MLKKQYGLAYQAFSRAAQPPGEKAARYHLMAGYCAWEMEDLAGAQRALVQAVKKAAPGGLLAKEAAQNLAAVKAYQRQRQALANPGG